MVSAPHIWLDEATDITPEKWDYLMVQRDIDRPRLPHAGQLLSETCVWRLQHQTIPFVVTSEGQVLGHYRGQLVHVMISREFGSDPDRHSQPLPPLATSGVRDF